MEEKKDIYFIEEKNDTYLEEKKARSIDHGKKKAKSIDRVHNTQPFRLYLYLTQS